MEVRRSTFSFRMTLILGLLVASVGGKLTAMHIGELSYAASDVSACCLHHFSAEILLALLAIADAHAFGKTKADSP